jgi:hypothetical protein
MNHIDASHHLEQLACYMAPAANAGQCHVKLAGLRVSD